MKENYYNTALDDPDVLDDLDSGLDGGLEDQPADPEEYQKEYSFKNREYEPEEWDENSRKRAENNRKKDPVATLDADHGHGLYDSYSGYRNENRKIRSDRRKDYAWYSERENRYYFLRVGDSSAVDNRKVNEADIAELHRMRDREVYHNNKYRFASETDEEFIARMGQEREKMKKGLPNDYESMLEESKERRLVVNIDAFVNQDGEDVTDHMKACASPKTVEGELGLHWDELENTMEKIMDVMTENEREVFMLVRYNHLSKTEAADILQVSEGTVRYRLKSADEKIKAHPFIQRYQEMTRKHTERIIAWEERQKELKAKRIRKKKMA